MSKTVEIINGARHWTGKIRAAAETARDKDLSPSPQSHTPSPSQVSGNQSEQTVFGRALR